MNNNNYTIAIPVYERLLGFEEAIQSAINVIGCTEILVVDDNSSHNEFEIISNLINDSRVRYIRNVSNIGLFGNWNNCVMLSKNEYISILCSDDIIMPNAFSLFLDACKTEKDIDVFFGSFATFEKTVSDGVLHRTFKKGKIKALDLYTIAIHKGPGFPVLSILRKSKVLNFPFVSKPHSGNDWLWIYSNAMSLNLYATDKIINFWRRHPDQDAVKSQSITMDCWPMMFKLIAFQLVGIDNRLSIKAMRRAKGIILSFLLNDYKYWENRINNIEKIDNIFIDDIIKIIKESWILTNLLKYGKANIFIYNIGRVYRKIGYYPS